MKPPVIKCWSIEEDGINISDEEIGIIPGQQIFIDLQTFDNIASKLGYCKVGNLLHELQLSQLNDDTIQTIQSIIQK